MGAPLDSKDSQLYVPDEVLSFFVSACQQSDLEINEVIEAAMIAATCMGPQSFMRECQMSISDFADRMDGKFGNGL